MAIILHPSLAREASTVLDLWRESGVEPTHTDDVESIQRLVVLDRNALVVAKENGRPVGSGVAAWDGCKARSTACPSLRFIDVVDSAGAF